MIERNNKGRVLKLDATGTRPFVYRNDKAIIKDDLKMQGGIK